MTLEIACFLVLALGYSLWEWRRPAHPMQRFAGLKLDALSFVVALCCALSSRELIMAVAGDARQSAALAWLRDLPFAIKLLLGLVAVDLSIYWIHRAQHAFAVGWRAHRWHHTVEHLNWLAGFRTSFLHSLVYNIPQTVVPTHLLGFDAMETGIACSIGLFVQFWDHANVKARIGWLKYVFVRPQDHRLHHAAEGGSAVNFGFVFCFWDRGFGTYRDGDTVSGDYALGLGEPLKANAVPRMLLGV